MTDLSPQDLSALIDAVASLGVQWRLANPGKAPDLQARLLAALTIRDPRLAYLARERLAGRGPRG